jgi:hypothetical protein
MHMRKLSTTGGLAQRHLGGAVEGRSNQQRGPLRGRNPQLWGRAHRSTPDIVFTLGISVHIGTSKHFGAQICRFLCFLVFFFLFPLPVTKDQPKFGVYNQSIFRPQAMLRLPCRSARSSGQKDCQRPIWICASWTYKKKTECVNAYCVCVFAQFGRRNYCLNWNLVNCHQAHLRVGWSPKGLLRLGAQYFRDCASLFPWNGLTYGIWV